MTLTTGRARPAEPDLSAFLLAHAGFRVEFGRLADVVAAPRDDRHAALVEDQLDLVLSCLHHHHTDEDNFLWPALRERAPRSVPLLDALEEQHELIDPDIVIAGDRARRPGERAAALRRLHAALNRHLDDEERDAVPLLRRHFTAGEWAAHGEKVVGGYRRSQLPALFGWCCASGTPELAASAIAGFPAPVRLAFRLLWWPAYRRRHQRLYGTAVRRHATRAR
jgi:hypothetical protein